MTLNQKFENVDILFESQLLKLKYDENMDCADDCEKIADDYAIEILESYHNSLFIIPLKEGEAKIIVEHLKKQKGL